MAPAPLVASVLPRCNELPSNGARAKRSAARTLPKCSKDARAVLTESPGPMMAACMSTLTSLRARRVMA